MKELMLMLLGQMLASEFSALEQTAHDPQVPRREAAECYAAFLAKLTPIVPLEELSELQPELALRLFLVKLAICSECDEHHCVFEGIPGFGPPPDIINDDNVIPFPYDA